MDAHEPTAANADLWATYFRNEWGRWLNPFGRPSIAPVDEVADGTAARVAGLLSLIAAPTIGWMYRNNVPHVISEAEQAADASVQVVELQADVDADADEPPVTSGVREDSAA